MRQTIYHVRVEHVDAFTDRPFAGNPAAVCVLPAPAADARMQAVSAEMNLSETAFLVRQADGAFNLRWFTPAAEVKLCGHATLASAHVLWETGALQPAETACFNTLSGLLTAAQRDGWIELNFPATPATPAEPGVRNDPAETDPLKLNLPKICSMDYHDGCLFIPDMSDDLIVLEKQAGKSTW